MTDQPQRGTGWKTRLVLTWGFGVILTLIAGLVYFSVNRLDVMHTELLNLDRIMLEKTRTALAMREAIRKRSFSLVLTSTLDDFFDRDQERQKFHQYERDYIMARERLRTLGLPRSDKQGAEPVQPYANPVAPSHGAGL